MTIDAFDAAVEKALESGDSDALEKLLEVAERNLDGVTPAEEEE